MMFIHSCGDVSKSTAWQNGIEWLVLDVAIVMSDRQIVKEVLLYLSHIKPRREEKQFSR